MGSAPTVSELTDVYLDVVKAENLQLPLLIAVDNTTTTQHPASPANILSVCQIGCLKLWRSDGVGELQFAVHCRSYSQKAFSYLGVLQQT